jgi:hypothetical protein
MITLTDRAAEELRLLRLLSDAPDGQGAKLISEDGGPIRIAIRPPAEGDEVVRGHPDQDPLLIVDRSLTPQVQDAVLDAAPAAQRKIRAGASRCGHPEQQKRREEWAIRQALRAPPGVASSRQARPYRGALTLRSNQVMTRSARSGRVKREIAGRALDVDLGELPADDVDSDEVEPVGAKPRTNAPDDAFVGRGQRGGLGMAAGVEVAAGFVGSRDAPTKPLSGHSRPCATAASTRAGEPRNPSCLPTSSGRGVGSSWSTRKARHGPKICSERFHYLNKDSALASTCFTNNQDAGLCLRSP